MGPHKSTWKIVQGSLVISRSLLWSIAWEALVCIPGKQSSQMNLSVESVSYHIPLKYRCPDYYCVWFRDVYLIYNPDSLPSPPSRIGHISATVCIVLMIVPLLKDYLELFVFVFRTVSFSNAASIWWKQGLIRWMSRWFFWLPKENSVEIQRLTSSGGSKALQSRLCDAQENVL